MLVPKIEKYGTPLLKMFCKTLSFCPICPGINLIKTMSYVIHDILILLLLNYYPSFVSTSSMILFEESIIGVLYSVSYCSSVIFNSSQIGIAVANPDTIIGVNPEP